MRRIRQIICVVLSLALLAPSVALAATPDQMAEARRRYDRALELSDEGNYDEALLELQRAYELAPTYRLLYNLGVVSVAVHDYVKAIDYFDRYLSEGGAEIDPARVNEVQVQVTRLHSRIAKLVVNVTVPGAEITIDDISVGRAPLTGPITVNAGRHRVAATLSGYFPASASIEAAGNESRTVTLTLVRPTVAPEKPAHPIPWLGWGITAALAAGTTVTGVLALTTESSYDTKVGTVGSSADDVSSTYRRMRELSVTSDVLLGATIIAAGVSLYLTLKPIKAKKEVGGLRLSPSGFVF